MENQNLDETDALPEPFVEQVEDALKHIYDLPYLEQHPLAHRLPVSPTGEPAGQHLRRELAAAIEALSPGPGVPFRAPRARLHNLLVLHYMEQMTIQEAANQLGVSSRQALRNLREAEHSLAATLWARGSVQSPEEAAAVRLSSLEAEMGQLAAAPRPTDFSLLLLCAQEAIQPRLVQRSLAIQKSLPGQPVILSTNATLAQQLLVSVLNYCTGQARPGGSLYLALEASRTPVTLILRYTPETAACTAQASPTITQLAEQLGWTVMQQDLPEGQRQMICQMIGRCATVLIIDDNQGLVDLLQRYLTDQACRVVTATSGQDGLRLARQAAPDAILLDVMMPGMQGWEVLQRLHNDPATEGIPVIICSVINEPELAQVLGATLFLPKPIRQVDVLAALRQLGIV